MLLPKPFSGYGLYLYAALIMIAFLGLSPVYILDEAKFTEAAREMVESGNYIVPYFNGNLFVDKPPFQYFMSILGFKLFGIHAFGARFFSAVFGLLTLWITTRFAKDFWGEKVAQYAALIFLSSFFLLQQFQLATPDPYLIFFCTAALFSFYRFFVHRKRKNLFYFYLLLGFGVLAKGPIAIALPGVSVGLFLIFSGEFKNTFKYYPVLGLALTLLVAAPWFVLVHHQTNGAWTEGFFIVHNFSRFSGAMEGHGGIFLLTWAYVLLGLLPFSFFIPQSLFKAFKNRAEPHVLFAFIVSLVFIGFFSISSTKLPNYTMPCYPFLILLLANFWQARETEEMQKGDRVSIFFLIFISTLLCFLPPLLGNEVAAFDKTPFIGLWLAPTAIGTLVSYFIFRRKHHKKGFLFMAGSWNVLFIILFTVIYPTLNRYNPVSQVTEQLGSDAPIAVYRRMDPAFPFNYQRQFTILETPEAVQNYLETHPDAYIMTNIRSSAPIDSLPQLEKVMQQKSPFEYHVTKVYQLKKETR